MARKDHLTLLLDNMSEMRENDFRTGTIVLPLADVAGGPDGKNVASYNSRKPSVHGDELVMEFADAGVRVKQASSMVRQNRARALSCS